MTGPLRPGTEVPIAGTVTVQPEGPIDGAVDAVTDGSVAGGGEEYGPPIPFESISGLSDEELAALADKYGIDTTTGLPKGVLVQEIHNRMTGVTPTDPQPAPVPASADPNEDRGDPLADGVVTIEKVGPDAPH